MRGNKLLNFKTLKLKNYEHLSSIKVVNVTCLPHAFLKRLNKA